MKAQSQKVFKTKIGFNARIRPICKWKKINYTVVGKNEEKKLKKANVQNLQIGILLLLRKSKKISRT